MNSGDMGPGAALASGRAETGQRQSLGERPHETGIHIVHQHVHDAARDYQSSRRQRPEGASRDFAITRIVGFFVSAMGVGLIFDGVVEALRAHGVTTLH
jgi:hypothetical protein